jgi:DNA-binding XRE family transcriptional regulator
MMIGDTIRQLRERRSWTQAHLAEAAGLSLRTVQRLETEHACAPETLLALAAALDVDVRTLTADAAPAPSPRRSAAPFAALLVLPCLLFVAANLLKYGAGVAAPYDLLASLGAGLGLVRAFDLLSPPLLVGGPAAAILLLLFAQVRPQARRQGRALTLTGVELRLDPLAIGIGLAAAGCLALLLFYLVLENLGHLARAV